MINKCNIENMMNLLQLHTLFISKPESGQPAYWLTITRGDSNCDLGEYRT